MGDKRKRSQLAAEDEVVEAAEVKQKKPKKVNKEKEKNERKKENKQKQKDEVQADAGAVANALGMDTEMKDVDEVPAATNGAVTKETEEKAKKAKKERKKKEKKAKKGDDGSNEVKDKKKKRKEKKIGLKDSEKGVVEVANEREENQEQVPEILENRETEEKRSKKDKVGKGKKQKNGKKAKIEKDETITMSASQQENGHVDVTNITIGPVTPTAGEHDIGKSLNFANGNDGEQKNQRFIVFIGNLPFHTTLEAVQKHFSKIMPSHVRFPSEKGGKKGRGFAFIEFDHYDRMKTCLKLYHHSSFDDGQNPPRKINVELTAGGGGSKSETRKARIFEKNTKLSEQRARAAKEAQKQKQKTGAAKTADVTGTAQVKNDLDDVHPSRRGRVPGV
ncbi:hypothetical protein PABG_05758 [Paracoccidioides brasiliensis Pb03]|nr:hypothetical protein PABG_05758 [Paracoccidioides brasiliensis Pb03]